MVSNKVDPTVLRRDADTFIEQSRHDEAKLALEQLWLCDSTAGTAAFLASRFERLRGKIPLVSHRVYILRSLTLEPAVAFLRAAAFIGGLDLTVQMGGFNMIAE